MISTIQINIDKIKEKTPKWSIKKTKSTLECLIVGGKFDFSWE